MKIDKITEHNKKILEFFNKNLKILNKLSNEKECEYEVNCKLVHHSDGIIRIYPNNKFIAQISTYNYGMYCALDCALNFTQYIYCKIDIIRIFWEYQFRNLIRGSEEYENSSKR